METCRVGKVLVEFTFPVTSKMTLFKQQVNVR